MWELAVATAAFHLGTVVEDRLQVAAVDGQQVAGGRVVNSLACVAWEAAGILVRVLMFPVQSVVVVVEWCQHLQLLVQSLLPASPPPHEEIVTLSSFQSRNNGFLEVDKTPSHLLTPSHPV